MSQSITITEDQDSRLVRLPETTPEGLYRLLLIPVDPDAAGSRRWYFAAVLPHINHGRVVQGFAENEAETHEFLKLECNGGRGCSGMSKNEWKDYLLRVQAAAICKVECGWLWS